MKYWINVISKDHSTAGAEGGFIQASQGKAAMLRLLHRDDVVFSYSPGTRFRAGEILQTFTAVARVTGDSSYQVGTAARVHSWRVSAASVPCEEALIEPLVPQMDVIEDKANWTASLRRGMFEIGEDDARRIADAMKADLGR